VWTVDQRFEGVQVDFDDLVEVLTRIGENFVVGTQVVRHSASCVVDGLTTG
jgi:hypothetical protein